jgi:PA-IL-like protein
VTVGFKITNLLGTFSVESGITAGLGSDSTQVSIVNADNPAVQQVYAVREHDTMTLCINGRAEEQISAHSVIVTVFNAPSVVELLPANAESCGFSAQPSALANPRPPASVLKPRGQSVTVTVPATADGGVTTGVNVAVGDTYRMSATGSGQNGYDSGDACSGYVTTHPDGSQNLGSHECAPKYDPSAALPTAAIGQLIWRIGNGPWQAAPASFTATIAGLLILAYNDDPGQYGDNSGFYTATVTCSAGC